MNTLLQKATFQQEDVVKILTGKKALALLAEQSFQLQWDTLYTSCPWSTVFQSRGFVYTWYQSYHTTYSPILAVAYCGEKLTGLLTLAQDDSGRLVGAGANQAEYQVWLTREQTDSYFIKKTLNDLLEQFPQSEISLKFVPANTPLQWLETDLELQKVYFRREVKQPLLSLNKENLSQELRKKNRREKLNRLKRQGELSFMKVTDAQKFSSVLDELAIQSDFRKGAMYNKCAFQEDGYRKEFLKKLFSEGLLHVTLLRVDNTIIASNVGVTGQNWVHLQGINTHSPMQAKHSPGILHFLMLGVMLAEEGIAVFDLTPGNDPYKESLATDFTHATELVFGNKAVVMNRKLKYNLTQYLKDTLPKLGIAGRQIKQMSHETAIMKEKFKLIKRQSLSTLLRKSIRSISKSNDLSIYSVQPVQKEVQEVPVNKNELQDLLCYTPAESLTSKWEFLIDAMRRLESGQHVYTWQKNGHLLGYAWLSEPKASKPTTFFQLELPEQAIVLHSFYCPSLDHAKTAAFIRAIVAHSNVSNDLPLYAVAKSTDKAVCRVLELLYPSTPASSN
ncbi:GNAT family N-acetyltransferase [Pontibacter lucknowensis]|uniref:Acetyltransferase involved in cellulose biosynthesis, CelD/BcsL family n=1 Tax=Pontibacter lucknowensis TaxID=1077936 RepID=A0A1N7AYT2_9BACT|nr:GNAT family N-acetyltransferase [Pontibacter lucknowensis]SIR44201.1 Acetyltransferase involved in cellulose biosynthesis, CelD/BcsL family [Pontibacter lucknowensis]